MFYYNTYLVFEQTGLKALFPLVEGSIKLDKLRDVFNEATNEPDYS